MILPDFVSTDVLPAMKTRLFFFSLALSQDVCVSDTRHDLYGFQRGLS